MAITLVEAGRLVDAREYACAALRNAETYGDRAANEIEVARKLIVEIERLMQVQEISPLQSLN